MVISNSKSPLSSEFEVSRRTLIRGGTALGATSLILPAPAFAQDTPRSGGTLRMGVGGGSTSDSLDPTITLDSVPLYVNFAIFNGLVENSPDNRPLPELAEAFESSDGARTWKFSLRKGVHFHNGKAFGADDAIYSLNLHRGESKSGAAASMKAVTGIDKVDQNTIVVKLASGDADFPVTLTDYHIMMVPDGFKDWSKPIGTGAFVVETFNPGVRTLLKKAPDYWKKGRGYLDAVDINVINDASARLNGLISGEVDVINRVDPKTVGLLSRNKSLQVIRAPGGWFPIMAMEIDQAPYSNPDLRKALQYAVDREQMIKTLFSGYGSLGNDNPIPKGDPYHNTELKQIAYDPDQAKFHFKKAGLTDPQINLQTSDAAFNGAVDMGTLLQATAGKCDIPVSVKKEPADGYFSNVWLKGHFVASYWGGRPAATQMLDVAFQSTAPWNESHWKVPKFDEVLAQAKAEPDEAKRKTLIWELQAMLTDTGGSLIPCFRDWLDAASAKIGGLQPNSGFDMQNGRICEKAWFKA